VHLPVTQGQIVNWPAVWSDGQNWPTGGESDILEGLSGRACFNVHSATPRPPSCVPGNYAGWHTFASEWRPGSMTYYYDGLRVGRITTSVSSPMYLVLAYTVAPAIYRPTSSPATMEVSYVRVWQH
jgi:beta-glucanase (GH16 family)